MGRFDSKKTQKKKFNRTRKGPLMQGGMMQAINNAATTKCDFDLKYNKVSANILGWTKQNLMKKVPTSDFLKIENKKFIDIFKRNLENFCVKNQNQKYIKFCVNFLSCANKPEKMYDLLYRMYVFKGTLKAKPETDKDKDKDKEDSYMVTFNGTKYKLTPALKALYNKRKGDLSLESSDAANKYTADQFIKYYEAENIKNVSKFIINVIKKSIVSYEKTKKPTPGETSEIVMKDKLQKLFTSLFGEKFEFDKITQEKMEEIFTKNKDTIEEYTDNRLMKTVSQELVDDDKEVKKSPFYMFVVFGAFIIAIILESGFMEAPPGLEGGMS